MISLVDYIFSNVEYLIGLMTDSKVASAIGANFFYIVLSLWVFWLMINFFLLRPMPGGSLASKEKIETAKNMYRWKNHGDYDYTQSHAPSDAIPQYGYSLPDGGDQS